MQLRLEGPTLEELLLEVEDSYAGKARIVGAEKVRRGGIGGFFAREHFEVTLEVAEGPAAPPGSQVPAAAATVRDDGPTDLLALAEQMSDREAAAGDFEPAEFARAAASTPPPAAAFDPTSEPVSLSTQEEDFSSVLNRLTQLTRDTYAPSDAALELPAQRPARPAVPQPAEPCFEPLAVPAPARAATAPQPAPRPAPAAGPAPVSAEVALVTAPRLPQARWNAMKLRSLGVPAALVKDAPEDASLEELISLACERIPVIAPEPLRRGDVVAVLGDGPSCLAAARAVAKQAGLPGSSVKLGSPVSLGPDPRLASPEAVHRQRLAWAGLAHPTVVALAGLATSNQAWLQSSLMAAMPTSTVLCVSATMKTSDARLLVRRVRPDSLIVLDHLASSDPATVLDLGVPVLMLDDERATAEVWWRLFTERTRARS